MYRSVPPPPRTFSHDATVLQVRLTTAQKLVVRHLKCHGLGPRIANRLVTSLCQHLMGLPLLGGVSPPPNEDLVPGRGGGVMGSLADQSARLVPGGGGSWKTFFNEKRHIVT